MKNIGSALRSVELFHFVALIYLVFTVIFAFERILHTDCSYQIFHSINDKGFFFQENRFGVFPTQLLLVAGIWAELPMKALVHLYSLGFPLIYIAAILVNHLVFRSKEAALATILGLVIGTRETFFHCTTETHLLLVFSCLLHGAFEAAARSDRAKRYYAVWALILIWGFFIHPNAIFTYFFVTGLAFLRKRITIKEALAAIAVCALSTLVKMGLTPAGSYDSKQYDQLFAWNENLSRFFDLPAVWFITSKPTDEYLGLGVLMAVLLIAYRKPLVLLFTFICAAGFLAITIFTFPYGDSLVMMEKAYMPAGFMFVLLFCVLFYRSRRKWPWTVLAVILAAHSFMHIADAGALFTERLDRLATIMKAAGPEHPKLIASFDHRGDDRLRTNHWATSLDALILSQSLDMGARTIFLTDDVDQYVEDTQDPDLFLYLPWAPYGSELKNKAYFDLPKVPYHIVGSRTDQE